MNNPDSIELLSSLTVYIDKVLGRPGSKIDAEQAEELKIMIKRELGKFENPEESSQKFKALRYENKSIKLKISDDKRKIECLARENQSIQAQVENLDLLLANKTKQYEETCKKAEAAVVLHVQHEELTKQFEALQQDLLRTKQQLDHQSKELGKLLLEKQSLGEQLSETAEKLFSTQLERDNMFQESQNLETTLAEKAALEEQLEKMKIETQNERVSTEMSLRDERSKNECLTRDIESTQAKADNLEILLEKMTREFEPARKNAELGAEVRVQHGKLLEQFKVLQEESTHDKDSIASLSEEKSNINKEKRSLEEQLTTKSNELSETVLKLLSTSAERDSAIKQAKGDAETLKTTLEANAEFERKLERTVKEVYTSEQTIQKELDEALATKTTLEIALAKIELDLSMERLSLEEVGNERDAVTIEKESLQMKIDAMVEDSTSSTQAAIVERDSAMQEKTRLEAECTKLNTEISEQNEKIQAKDQELQQAIRKVEEANKLIEILQQAVVANKSAIDSLTDQLAEKRVKLDESMDSPAKFLTDLNDQKQPFDIPRLRLEELDTISTVSTVADTENAFLKEQIEKLKTQNAEQYEYIASLESMEDFVDKFVELKNFFADKETEGQTLK